jgi:hypothetical protein
MGVAVFLFLVPGLCWGPVFHQRIARDFSLEYFPLSTDRQRELFAIGSIYADGLDKMITHHIPLLREKICQIYNPDADVYWFMLGIYAHIPPDTFAHAGKSRSFITAAGWKHSLSELIVDSFIMHSTPLPRLTIPVDISRELDILEIRSSWKFPLIYWIEHWISKLPLYFFLPRIEQDRCSTANLAISACNFRRHYSAMLQALREAMPLVLDTEFNDVRVKELATRLVFGVGCCELDQANITLEQPLLQNEDPGLLWGDS